MSDLLANPSSTQWADSSIEFCGGTHISNTKEAQRFVLTEETAVAKGIRRISGITGSDAVEARALTESLLAQVDSLRRLVDTDTDASNVESNEALVTTIRAALDTSIISQATKNTLREELSEKIAKQILVQKNKKLLKMVDNVILRVKEEALAAVAKGDTTAVFHMEIGSYAKAIKRATEEIKKVAPGLSFLGLSYESEGETLKITGFSSVTDTAQASGLKANDWVSAVLVPLGGRGGGRPNSAQGSALVQTSGVTDELKSKLTASAKAFLSTTVKS